MAVNKVVYGSETLIDLTADTATSGTVLEGYTLHLANGQQATGSFKMAQKSFYGTCATAAATQAKVVVCSDFALSDYDDNPILYVKMTNNQTYNGGVTLNVNSTGAKNVARIGSTTSGERYYWLAGELVAFVYDGTNWLMLEAGLATTTYYGMTKLYTGAVSTSTALALTPASLNSLAQYMLSGVAVYSASATYAVGDRVRYGYYIYECNTAITTAEAWDASHWTALDSLQEQIDDKQDELVSGTNIKTVNGNSLLGSGNLVISGGTENNGMLITVTSVGNVHTADKTQGEILTALNSGIVPLVHYGTYYYPIEWVSYSNGGLSLKFREIDGNLTSNSDSAYPTYISSSGGSND